MKIKLYGKGHLINDTELMLHILYRVVRVVCSVNASLNNYKQQGVYEIVDWNHVPSLREKGLEILHLWTCPSGMQFITVATMMIITIHTYSIGVQTATPAVFSFYSILCEIQYL